jgi:quercetin dioxygenase-like cupin family protein
MEEERKDSWRQDPVIALREPLTDGRGLIQPLVSLEEPRIQSAVWIESKRGAVRANHYHKRDWHYCYVVSGSIEYYHRPTNSDQEPEKTVIKAGELFYTPPMVEHAMVFPEDTAFLTLSGGTRIQKDYESDLVRVNLV